MSVARPAIAAALLVAAACHAPRPAALAPAPERAPDRVWFTGESNIRRFTCRTDSARVALALPAGATVDAILAGDTSAVAATLALPVATLDCGIGTQSKHLHEALKAAAAPTIEFRLAGYRLADYRLGRGGIDTPVELRGTLRVAGAERPVTLAGMLHRDSSGALRLRGEQHLRPTDFGVTPPRRFAGLLRVRDEVTVRFDVGVRAPGVATADATR